MSMRWVVLRVAEGQGAAQLVGLAAVGLYLGEEAFGRNGFDEFPGYVRAAGVEGEGDDLSVVSGAEPGFQLLGVAGGEGFALLQQLHGVEHFDERIAVQHAIAAAFAVVEAGNHLGVLQVGIHACLLVEEPHADKLGGLFGVGLVTAEVPGQGKGGDAAGGGAQAVAVEALQLGVGLPVAIHVGQPVGFRGVGPVVACLAQVVVLVAAGGRLVLHHHAEGLGVEQAVGLAEQRPVGGGVEGLVERLFHLGQVPGVPNGLGGQRARRKGEGKGQNGLFEVHVVISYVCNGLINV